LNGTLMVHTGGRNRTREELALLPTPEATDTWKPVPHYELVESLIEGLIAHNITITREAYATSGKDDARLFGVLDLVIPDVAVPDFGMLRLRHVPGSSGRRARVTVIWPLSA
jgi:hypothetical protein